MHDLRKLRENPAAYDSAWARRGLSAQTPEILSLDSAERAAKTARQDAEAARNAASKEIGAAKAARDEARAEALMAAVAEAKEIIARETAAEAEASRALHARLAGLPNPPAPEVPDGGGEEANIELRRWGAPPAIAAPKDHVALGEAWGLMEFEGAAAMSGARFVALKGALARLERALAAFMLDVHTGEFGYQEVSPPLLVKPEALFGTGQLPKFEEDLFQTTDGRFLIPTAEVSLTNLVRGRLLDPASLPLRFTADTACFRSEAGSAGRDTRGMIRMHQFRKVELVSITTPEAAVEEHERMTACAEEILQRLGLAYRVMLLCAGDMGFSARKTYDLEVWLPSQGKYREISSCSDCGDFQARRLNARFKREGEKGPVFVHTLNGSGLAVGRTLVAVLENYQEPDGSVTIPAALRAYLGGMERIAASSGA